MFQEVVRVAHGLDDAVHTALALMRVASLIAATEAEPAANLLGCVLKVNEELGLDLPPYAAKRRDEVMTKLHGQLDEQSLTRALQRGRRMGLDAGVALALEQRSLAE
jgi:hypothetical protein